MKYDVGWLQQELKTREKELESLQKQLNDMKNQVSDLMLSNSEWQNTFDTVWKSDRKAVELWRKVTGKEKILPDRCDMVVFLMAELEKVNAKLLELDKKVPHNLK